jgi:nicotinamidase-related amidase
MGARAHDQGRAVTLRAPITADALHLVIDMQRLFVEHPDWRVPDLMAIVPAILSLVRAHRQRTLFTRFVTPAAPEDAAGQWQSYYRHWRSVTLERMNPALLDLVPELAAHAAPDRILDKRSHGGFEAPEFAARLAGERASTLVLSGVETEVCVLALAFAATDRGYRAVIVSDAVTSSSPQGHRAALSAVFPRLDQQIEIATAAEVLAAWPAAD